MWPYGCIDAYLIIVIFRQDGVQSLTHAVQALKFKVTICCARKGFDRSNRMRIMCGKHRVDLRTLLQHFLCANQVIKICMTLAGKDRVVKQTMNLCMFDLAVPIGALDQPDMNVAFVRFCGLLQPVNNRCCAFLICLYGKAKAVPEFKLTDLQQSFEDL